MIKDIDKATLAANMSIVDTKDCISSKALLCPHRVNLALDNQPTVPNNHFPFC